MKLANGPSIPFGQCGVNAPPAKWLCLIDFMQRDGWLYAGLVAGVAGQGANYALKSAEAKIAKGNIASD